MMKRGSQVTLKIEKTEFPSMGISELEGKKIYVKGAFPGQTIKGTIKKKRDTYAEAKLVEVLEKAPYEVDAPCPHFGVCGGCSSQNLTYEKQLELLGEEICDLFEERDLPMGMYLGVKGSPNRWEYRNKMEFTFGDMEKGGELTLGMHMKGKSFGILTVKDCMIVDEDFRKVLTLTEEYFRKTELPYYRVMKREGYLRHLVIRKASNTGELMVNLVTTTQIDFDLTEYTELLKNQSYKGELVSVLHTENNSFSDAVIPEKVNILYGKDYIVEDLLGLKFKISPFSFFQTNSKGAESLYSIVRDFMGDGENKVVFDLYCGTGTIGQIAAANAKKVVGLELIEEAVEAAKENAKLNGLNNCEFIAGDVAETIKQLKDKPDIIILDPPRSGVSPKALDYVIKFNAKEIIYVSCNPKTMVENLEVLMAHGYMVEKSTVKDMFPNTPHAEVVVKLTRS
jgi:23S rRNA (uracil-5-)-methyltransferase RumA